VSPQLAFVLLLLAVAAALIYWEIYICEGAHLGERFVIWLYDLTARRYDGIKDFDPDWERGFLGEPAYSAIGELDGARVLDVGAGTGRLARSMLPAARGRPLLVNLDASRSMIAEAVKRVDAGVSPWVLGQASTLPFAAATFDLVASLEMLEFTRSPRACLAEMERVLRPGGWLLVTNRVGRQARWILGRTFGRDRFAALLGDLGLEGVETFDWQVEYDLVWARKPDEVAAAVRP
jgi:SAM-dependent methyltransferase